MSEGTDHPKNRKREFALVTGGSGGIGQAIAARLSRDGFSIALHYRSSAEKARAIQDKMESQGGTCKLVQFDLSDAKSIEAAMESLHREGINIEVLINNGGIHRDGLLGLMSDEAFDEVMKTNAYGPFVLMRYCVRKMLRAKRGIIVNIASLAGQAGNAGQINYAASKAALIAMTRSLAMEVGSRQIRVNAVAPGFIETEMIAGVPGLEQLVERIPLKRCGKPEDVAGAVSFLCSEDATYITGQVISVNGGLFPA